jgi:hypothetical protein
MRGLYVVNMTRVSVSAAITLIQLQAGATNRLEIVEARVSQSNSTTSTMQPVQIMRKSAAGTVTSFTPLLLSTGDAVSTAVGGAAATGTNASAEGTDTDILVQDVFNILNGWLYLPVPEQRPVVDGAGIIGLKLPVAPGSALTITASITFKELS